MSVANTLRRSHGQGCREGGEGEGGGSSGAGMRTSKRGSCSGSSSTSGDALGTTSDRTREWGARTPRYLSMWNRGGGTRAQRRARKSRGVENDRACPIFPGGLESVANPPVLSKVEAVLCERRPGHVTAEALESFSVATVDRDLGVDVDAADFGDGVVWRGATRESGSDEFRGLVSRGLSEELEVVCGGGVAGGEDGRGVMERVAASFVDDAFEGPAVTVEHADHTRVSPGGHLSDIVVGRRLKGVEGQLSFFVADVYPVECEGMEMNIHAERTVASLHEGDGAGEGVLH